MSEMLRDGRNNVRVDDKMRDCIEEILNENCLLMPPQVNQMLRRRLHTKPKTHDRTVARTLDRVCYSARKVGRTPPALRFYSGDEIIKTSV